MIIGFTGTQNGMNDFQKAEFLKVLEKFNPVRLNHGDCIGADKEAHFMFLEWHASHDNAEREIHIYSPTLAGKIAFCSIYERWPSTLRFKLENCENPVLVKQHSPKPYLERNKDIVLDSDILIACPKEPEHTLRSGTWATVRYGWKQKKTVIVIPPLVAEQNEVAE